MSARSLLARVPPAGGTYALHLQLSRARRITVGRLGEFAFEAGDYLYVGSAFGAGGLRARIRHHLARGAKPHWHIDYLRARASLCAVAYTNSPLKYECDWACALLRLPGARSPAGRFGASDCRAGCAAHLIQVRGERWREALGAFSSGDVVYVPLYPNPQVRPPSHS